MGHVAARPSHAPEAADRAAGAAPTVRTVPAHTPMRSAGAPRHAAMPGGGRAGALVALQRTAGNRAVAGLAHRARPPTLAPRLTPSTADRVAQRGLLEDTAGAVLPDWVTDSIFGARDREARAASDATRRADATAADATTATDAAIERVDGAVAGAERAGTDHQARSRAVVSGIDARASTVGARMGEVASSTIRSLDTISAGGVRDVSALEQVGRFVGCTGADAPQASPPATGAPAAGAPAATDHAPPPTGVEISCPAASIYRGLEAGADLVGKPFGCSGKEVLGAAGKAVRAIGSAVTTVVGDVAAVVRSAAAAWDRSQEWLREHVGTDVHELAREFASAVTNPIRAAQRAVSALAGSVTRIVAAVAKDLGAIKSALSNGDWKTLHTKVSTYVSMLPGPLRTILRSLGLKSKEADEEIARKAAAAGGAAESKATSAGERAMAAVEHALTIAIGDETAAREKAAATAAAPAERADREKRQAAAEARRSVDEPAAVGERDRAQMKEAARLEHDRLTGKVCVAFDEIGAGECVEEYLPDPGKGGARKSVVATTSSELAVPVYAGAHLKVANGASVTVARQPGTKTFTVTAAGEGALYLSALAGKDSSVSVKVDLPGGAVGDGSKVWKALNGEGLDALGNDPATKAKLDADAGVKGTSELVWSFTAGATSCEGLGGLVALLAALGVDASGILSPLGPVGAAAFEPNLTSKKFTLAKRLQAAGEVGNALGKLAAEGGLEVGWGYAEERTGGTAKPTLELFANVSGGGGGELDIGALSGIAVKGGASGGVTVVLAYDSDRDRVTVSRLVGRAGASVAGSTAVVDAVDGKIPGARARFDELVSELAGERVRADFLTLGVDAELTIDPAEAQTGLGDVLTNPQVASQATVLSRAREALAQLGGSGKVVVVMVASERHLGGSVEINVREGVSSVMIKGGGSVSTMYTKTLGQRTFRTPTS